MLGMTLGERLQRERERQKLTQEQLAIKAGLPPASGQQTVAYLERNKSQRSKFAQQLADALGVDVTYLLTGHTPAKQAYRLPDRIAAMMSLIPKDAQQRIERTILAMLEGEETPKPKRLHAVAGGKR